MKAADFAGGRITSDVDGLLLRELDQGDPLTEKAVRCLLDPHDSKKVKPDLLPLVRQRLFAIAQGYEDNNDAATLDRNLELVYGNVLRGDVENRLKELKLELKAELFKILSFP